MNTIFLGLMDKLCTSNIASLLQIQITSLKVLGAVNVDRDVGPFFLVGNLLALRKLFSRRIF